MKKFLIVTIGLLSLLAIVFVCLGLFVKETNYEVETTIDLPLENTFTLFNDKSKTKEWLTSIKSITPINITTNMVGSSHKIIVDNKGTDFEMIENITHFEPNKKIGLEFEVPGMIKNDVFKFISNGNQTKIVNKVSCKGQTFIYKATFPLLKSVFKRENQLYLDNFKAFAEKK